MLFLFVQGFGEALDSKQRVDAPRIHRRSVTVKVSVRVLVEGLFPCWVYPSRLKPQKPVKSRFHLYLKNVPPEEKLSSVG